MSPGEGAVTSLAFFIPAGAYNPTHLLSGAADGTLTGGHACGGARGGGGGTVGHGLA